MFTKHPPEGTPDWQKELHPSWRRYTRRYRHKRGLVRDLWICSGLLMTTLPLGGILSLGLLTSFLALMILDESC